ncbi:nitrate- and nitrite sensing domain-containing protein [Streptomyces sp. NPDC005438]|uniref:nitrate- and nitrite sensing domain-containing protein n=1 Tax=Streptomyces sp. NPDC005438 TaxID=3156880 RepID=UPI0033B6992D
MQGRFKRDGSAEGDQELRGVTDRGSAPQRAEEIGSSAAGQEPAAAAPTAGQTDGEAGGDAQQSEPNYGSRFALRNWRISTRLVSLLVLPVVAATTLGTLRIQDSLGNVDQLENMKLLTEMTKQATELASALQEERDRSAGPLAGDGSPKDDSVVAPRERTDQAIDAFHDSSTDLDESDSDNRVLAGVRSTVVDIGHQLKGIKRIRERAYSNEEYISETVDSYSQLIESLLSLSQDMAQATSSPEMIRSTRALAAFSSAKEYASIQRAVISAGLAREGGPGLSESDRLYGKKASESETAKIDSFGQIYGTQRASELIEPLDGGNVNITTANKVADEVLGTRDGIKNVKRTYVDWFDLDRSTMSEMVKIEGALLDEMEEQAVDLRTDAQRDALINGALILLVLGISLVGAFVVARSMVRSLRRLQDTAQDVARKRLPDLVKQMSEAEPQEVDTSVTSVGVHSRDEIGRVASAFDDVHREAVRLAGEQALLRGNVNAMFTNLSRRSQSLIQRQLSLISELESREADPDQLSSLFKLDHLATRMRRNGENLLVLAGEEPGRRWTRPVPLVDVLRAAASEVEQYERIELNAVPASEVAGRVVNDLVHLLAELLENATSFSSPQTKVKVTGHALPDGRVLVEVHDTGIGLSPEDLAAINERLANPPTVDVSVSRRMGLFVVGRLSLRHGIRIQLRPSDSGGTTALVMLPVDVTQGSGPSGTASKGRTPVSPGATSGMTASLHREPPQAGQRGAGQPPRSQVRRAATRPELTGGDGPNTPQDRPTGEPNEPQDRPQEPQDRPQPVPPRTASGLPTRTRDGARSGGAPETQGTPVSFFGEAPPSRSSEERPDSGNRLAPLQTRRGAPSPNASDQPTPSDTPVPPTGVPTGPSEGGRGGDTGQRRPSWATEDRPRGHDEPASSTQEHAGRQSRDHSDTSHFTAPPEPHAGPQEIRQFAVPPPAPQQPGQFATPQPYDRIPEQDPDLGVPTGSSAPDDMRTPIFESMESNWFREQGAAQQQPPEEPEPAAEPSQEPQPAPVGGLGSEEELSSDTARLPRRRTAPTAEQASAEQESPSEATGRSTGGSWGASPNDERWRQAEQVRQPSAGGVTTSGLPRRVPRANLVAGTAQQQSTARSGPQVSRSPDDVRGRLTNLRRGIQQGRQAGERRGTGPSHQQER